MVNRSPATFPTSRLSSHTFCRVGAQYRFVYVQPDRRWSLRMIKWWTGWGVSESTEALVRYVHDVTIQSEESALADCMASGNTCLHGSPSASYEATKNTEVGPVLKFRRRPETLALGPTERRNHPKFHWAHLCLMWWAPDESLHQFKPLSKWSPAERAKAGITRSCSGAAKLLGEDVGLFAKSSWRN
ncbi:hypothetical protein GQ600_13605 [Phytophthora cactorum]|nr:hypothetical protein GQ600_13605 [Phytophthora cactorum]